MENEKRIQKLRAGLVAQMREALRSRDMRRIRTLSRRLARLKRSRRAA